MAALPIIVAVYFNHNVEGDMVQYNHLKDTVESYAAAQGKDIIVIAEKCADGPGGGKLFYITACEC